MNSKETNPVDRTTPTGQTLITATSRWWAHLACHSRPLGRALALVGVVALLLSPTTFGAGAPDDTAKAATTGGTNSPGDSSVSKDPAKAASSSDKTSQDAFPLTKPSKKEPITGGVDPHGDSWQSIKNSFQQFASPQFVLRLFLSLTLSVACAWMIAWHPRSVKRRDGLSEIEERKAFIILGLVGAVVAELSGTSSTLAFVIFGIGALLRFRTVLDNPKASGKAIMVVVIGLACGMGSWTMAVFVTAFSWVLLFWLDSHVTYTLTIRLSGTGDPKPLENAVLALLASHRCRLHGATLSKSRKRMEFLFQMPATLDQDRLEADVKAKLPKTGESQIIFKAL